MHNTIPKNIILNWLYSTDRHVSLEKLGNFLEENTDGQYKLIKTNSDVQTFTNKHLRRIIKDTNER